MVALFVQVSLAWSAALPVQCGLCSLTQVSQCLAPGDDLADGGLRTVRPYWAADRRHRHGAIRVAFGRHGAYVPATIQAFLAGGWCAVMALLGKRDRVPAKVRKMWLLEAVAQHRQGGCWVLTDHPFIGGRPSRLDSLEELVEHVKALDGIWVTTLAENYRAHRAAGIRSSTAHALRATGFQDAPAADGVPVGTPEPVRSGITPQATKGQ